MTTVARKSQLTDNYQKILNSVPREKLIAVSKYHTFEDIEILYQLGHRDFGESRVQDLKVKAELATGHQLSDIRWHFIGHLQSKKVKDLFSINNLYALHSVDSLKLAGQLMLRADLLSRPLHIFLQMNTSGEEEKNGVYNLEELTAVFRELYNKHPSLILQGLMTIGKVRTDNFEVDAKNSFSLLNESKAALENQFNTTLQLSMGMSADFHWALEYGSDFVRIGSAIFSES